jgi:tetratricopeptide (TPR) repeat protein
MTEMGDYEEAVKRFAEAIDLFEKMGAVENCALAKHHAAAALLELGEYTRGFAMLESAISLFETVRRSPGAGASYLLKASYFLKMGRTEEAISHLEKGWEILAEEGRWRDKALGVEVRVEAAILSGEMERALEESGNFLEEARRGEVKAIYHSALLTRLRVLLDAGKTDEAREVADILSQESDIGQNPRNEAISKLLLSRLSAINHDFTAARRLLDEAVSSGRLSAEMCAQAYFWLGEALLASGDSEEAEKSLATAKDKYSTLVSRGYREGELERTNHLLDKCSK